MEHLFFDLDGTLTNPQEGITRCIEHALIKLDHNSNSKQSRVQYIGMPLRAIFSDLLKTNDTKTIEIACTYYRDRFATIGLYENIIYPQIPEALSALNTLNYKLWLVTAKPTVFARQILKHFNLDIYFEGVYGSNLDGTLTDKQDIIACILKKESICPNEAIMIGDRDIDILGARANKLISMAVTWGFATEEELNIASPTFIANTPMEIVSQIQSIATF